MQVDYWKCKDWEGKQEYQSRVQGLQLRFEKGVDCDVRKSCLKFAKWLRQTYQFPIRVIVYVRKADLIKCQDGDHAYGTFWRPSSKTEYPYIRIATGDYDKLFHESGRDDALATILECIAMMLTHYYQWLNFADSMSEEQEMKNAEFCAFRRIREYGKTRDHP